MRYFIRLAYDGSDFHGWQRQPNAVGVQQIIEEALSIVLQRPTQIVGAGRTDAGVHAKVMYAHFDCEEIPDKIRMLKSLNHMVGHSVYISDILAVKPDAHARFDAVSREYSYFITLEKNPFLFNYSHRMFNLPDVENMNRAARLLLDIDDFTSFAKLHSDAKTNRCKVSKAEWVFFHDKKLLVFNISADRFLRNMVRAIVGTLLEVGTGKMNIQEFLDVINKKDRCAAGTSMPAKGLFLTNVIYPEEIFVP